MAGGRLPTWGFVVASVAACCVVAMVALAVNPKPASLLSLPGMHAKQDPMQAQQVLSFLTKNSNTPNAEVKFLEDRLGVKSAGKAAALKASPAAKAGAVTPDQVSLLPTDSIPPAALLRREAGGWRLSHLPALSFWLGAPMRAPACMSRAPADAHLLPPTGGQVLSEVH